MGANARMTNRPLWTARCVIRRSVRKNRTSRMRCFVFGCDSRCRSEPLVRSPAHVDVVCCVSLALVEVCRCEVSRRIESAPCATERGVSPAIRCDQVRTSPPPVPSILWTTRTKGGKISVNEKHADFPQVVAFAFAERAHWPSSPPLPVILVQPAVASARLLPLFRLPLTVPDSPRLRCSQRL